MTPRWTTYGGVNDMRIVLDTNVLARAVRGGTGPASELLGIVMVPPHTFILSPFLLSELSRALRYERMRKLHKLDDAQLDTYVQSLQAAALVVNPPPPRRSCPPIRTTIRSWPPRLPVRPRFCARWIVTCALKW